MKTLLKKKVARNLAMKYPGYTHHDSEKTAKTSQAGLKLPRKK